jgi:hypothetical protein
MAATGETYQQAHQGLLATRQSRSQSQTDLQAVRYHGFPATLVTIEQHGAIVTLLMPSVRLWPQGCTTPWPASLLRAWMKPQGGLQ